MTGSRRAGVAALCKGKDWWRRFPISSPVSLEPGMGQKWAEAHTELHGLVACSALWPSCPSCAAEKAGPRALWQQPSYVVPTGLSSSSCRKACAGTCQAHMGCQAGCGAVVLRLESWGPRALDGTSVCHGKPRVSKDTERSGGVHPQSGSRRSATERGWVSSSGSEEGSRGVLKQ